MARPYEVMGTYGGSKTRTMIYVYPQRDSSSWYAVDGSTNINRTWDDLRDGVDVETLDDFDTMQSDSPVESTDDLEREVDE